MENSTCKIIDALNDLIQIQNYRLEGYKKAQEFRNQATDIKNLLFEGISLSYSCRKYLVKSIMLLGGNCISEKRITGMPSRAWLNVKLALLYDNRKMILTAFETGENQTQRAYDGVLKMNSVPLYIREILLLEKQKLQEQYEHIKNLRRAEITREKLPEKELEYA